MIRIRQDISVAEAMRKILEDDYAAVPPSNYKRQLRTQINNVAVQDERFCNAFERVIEDEFSDIPRLDEIEDLIDEMPQSLKDILEQYGIIETAKQFAKEDSTWCGHEMTPKQKELCETVWVSVSDWCKAVPKGCDISVNLEQAYEHKTGKSCVNWYDPDNDDGDWCHDTLPRPENYASNGYTEEFEKWTIDFIVKAVVEEGRNTQKKVANFIRKECPVVQG